MLILAKAAMAMMLGFILALIAGLILIPLLNSNRPSLPTLISLLPLLYANFKELRDNSALVSFVEIFKLPCQNLKFLLICRYASL